MAVAACAARLDPAHSLRDIGMLRHDAWLGGLGEARPTAARIIFRIAFEQPLSAAGAAIFPAFVVIPVASRKGALGACLTQNRSEEHTSELQSLMRISYAVFCLKKKKHKQQERI